jgi:hypothetical protein
MIFDFLRVNFLYFYMGLPYKNIFSALLGKIDILFTNIIF